MIITIFLTVLNYFIDVIVAFLPTWTLYPQGVLDGLTYIFGYLAKLNIIMPIDTLFSCIKFMIGFFQLFIPVVLIYKLIHFARGSK